MTRTSIVLLQITNVILFILASVFPGQREFLYCLVATCAFTAMAAVYVIRRVLANPSSMAHLMHRCPALAILDVFVDVALIGGSLYQHWVAVAFFLAVPYLVLACHASSMRRIRFQ